MKAVLIHESILLKRNILGKGEELTSYTFTKFDPSREVKNKTLEVLRVK